MGKSHIGMEIRIGKMMTETELTELERLGLMKLISDQLGEEIVWKEDPVCNYIRREDDGK